MDAARTSPGVASDRDERQLTESLLMDALTPEHPPVTLTARAGRPPRVWKFWGTALWGLFIFAGMFVGQAAVIAYIWCCRQGGLVSRSPLRSMSSPAA